MEFLGERRPIYYISHILLLLCCVIIIMKHDLLTQHILSLTMHMRCEFVQLAPLLAKGNKHNTLLDSVIVIAHSINTVQFL